MNENYIEKIKAANDEKTIIIDCTKNSIIKKKAFDAIKNTKKKLILVNDGIQWVFSGEDITGTKNIDTKILIYKFAEYGNISLLNCFYDENKGLIIEFAPNGKLPGKVLIKIKADYTFRNYIGEKNLYIYRYIETKNGLELIAEKIEMSDDGFYEFYIDHNSKYIVTQDKAKESALIKVSTKPNSNPDKNSSVVPASTASKPTPSLSPTPTAAILTPSLSPAPTAVEPTPTTTPSLVIELPETSLRPDQNSNIIVGALIICIIIICAVLIINKSEQ